MRSDSVGIAGHLGPIPPVAGKLPKRDHLQLGTSSQHLVFGLNWPPHSSLIALHASDSLWPPNPLLPNCLPPPLPSCRLRSSSQEFTFSAFDSPWGRFSDSIAIVSPSCSYSAHQLLFCLCPEVGGDCGPRVCAKSGPRLDPMSADRGNSAHHHSATMSWARNVLTCLFLGSPLKCLLFEPGQSENLHLPGSPSGCQTPALATYTLQQWPGPVMSWVVGTYLPVLATPSQMLPFAVLSSQKIFFFYMCLIYKPKNFL